MAYSRSFTNRFRTYRTTTFTDCSGQASTTQTHAYVPYTDTKQGTSVPSWQSKISAGLGASSDYVRRSASISTIQPTIAHGHGSGCINNYPRPWSHTGTMDLIRIGTLPSVVPGLQDSEALRKFWKSVDGSITKVQSLPFLAELGKSKKLMLDTAGTLLKAITTDGRRVKEYANLLKRKRYPFRRASREISKRWLEYQFGWSPLISDLNNAREELSEPLRTSFRIVGKSTDEYLDSSKGSTNVGGITFDTTYSAKVSITRRYVAGLNIAHDPAESFGATFSSVPGAVWELTPWSYLLDYFFDVGTFLSSVQHSNLRFKYTSMSTLYKIDRTSFQLARMSPANGKVLSCVPGSCGLTQYHYERSSFLPTVYLPTFRLMGALDGVREWNIAALLGCRVSRW